MAQQLLLDCLGVTAALEEDAVAIDIQGQRDALAADHLAQPLHVPLGVFLLPEHRPGHCTGGVVDAADEGQPGTVRAQPLVAAAIGLQQHAFLGHPLPAAAMLGRTARAWTGEPCRSQDTVDAHPTHRQLFLLEQLLHEVLVVKTVVLPPSQTQHLLPDRLRQAVSRRAATVAMHQRRRSFSAEAGFQPSYLPW